MSRRQQLRLAGRFLRHRFRSIHPFEVQASLLNACNLKCEYCRCPDMLTPMLTTAEWRRVDHSRAREGRHVAHQVPGRRADAGEGFKGA